MFTNDRIVEVLGDFKGKILQVPPVYSALHKNGERLHRLARSGKDIRPQPREVEIKDLRLLNNGRSFIHIDVTASKGAYVRALARDIANSLGTCGYLSDLQRLRIGSFSVEHAITAEEVDESTPLLSMAEALHDFPQYEVGTEIASRVRNGIPARNVLSDLGKELPGSGFLCLVNCGQLIAVVELQQKPGYFKVFGRSKDMPPEGNKRITAQ